MTKKKTPMYVRITFAAHGSGNRLDLLDIFEVSERNFRTKSYAAFIGKALLDRSYIYNPITVTVEARVDQRTGKGETHGLQRSDATPAG